MDLLVGYGSSASTRMMHEQLEFFLSFRLGRTWKSRVCGRRKDLSGWPGPEGSRPLVSGLLAFKIVPEVAHLHLHLGSPFHSSVSLSAFSQQ